MRRGLRGHADRRGQPRHRARRRSPRCATSTTAAPPAPRSTPATAPGILLQVPDAFLREVVDFDLPAPARTPSGTAFLEGDADQVAKTRQQVEELADEEGLTVLGWRDVPVDPDTPRRDRARRDAAVQPAVRRRRPAPAYRHGAGAAGVLPAQARRARDRRLLRLAQRAAPCSTRACSPPTSSTAFFPDLTDERVASALAVVHSRFSTNTFPSWPLAHPFRYIAHNGEINTVMGNRNWMRAREALLDSDLIPGDLERLFPICTPGASDSASFDEVLELLHMGGRTPAPRGADDDPGGLGEPPGDGRRSAGPSTSSTPR